MVKKCFPDNQFVQETISRSLGILNLGTKELIMGKWFGKLTANRYFRNGNMQVLKGNYQSAIKKFSKAIEANPKLLDAYLFRGNAYIDNGEYAQGVIDLDHVIQIRPDNAVAYYNRGIGHMALGHKDQALADADQSILLAPEEAGYYLHRGIIHSFREEYDLSLKDADKVIELGDAKKGHNNRAVVFEKKGDDPAAIAEWTKVLEIEPNNSTAYCKRGILLGKGGDIKSATDDLKKGLKHKEKISSSLRDQAEKALFELEKAL
jgi:tetratricopeptide (TPR) repeat protein